MVMIVSALAAALLLLGIAVQIGGFAAHAVALRSGPLTTVQMLVSGELVVADGLRGGRLRVGAVLVASLALACLARTAHRRPDKSRLSQFQARLRPP